MRKQFKVVMMVICLLFLSVNMGWAGRGTGTGGQGNGGGTGPIHDILGGTPFTITGSIISLLSGQGMKLSLADGSTADIFGIGPIWYWQLNSVDRPTVGEEVSVSGFTVEYNEGVFRNIAMTITVDGEAVQLRDPNTGNPLWRGGRNHANQ